MVECGSLRIFEHAMYTTRMLSECYLNAIRMLCIGSAPAFFLARFSCVLQLISPHRCFLQISATRPDPQLPWALRPYLRLANVSLICFFFLAPLHLSSLSESMFLLCPPRFALHMHS
jgi:hypothetical protein